jgi:hypothetical protein
VERRIAYLGDTSLPGAASYLAGIMTHFRLPFVYVPSDEPPPAPVFEDAVGLYVLSDYPATRFAAGTMERLCARVRDGAGLLMLGGWESYHGLGGDYDRTPLADLLPVVMSNADDRRNCPQLVLVRKCAEHPITAGLPFDMPPSIGGYNEFRARPSGRVILEGDRYRVTVRGEEARLAPEGRFPLLVVEEGKRGSGGAGRRACLATDVAPHWVGGFVDWGDTRLTVRLNGDFVEVGAWYAAFFRNLLVWCLG